MAVNNEIGTIQDIPRISSILSDHGIPLHCDAAQAPAALDVGDLATHAEMISLSAHKMYGRPGIAALSFRRDLQSRIEPTIHGRGQHNGLRSGTLPLALCVGMGAAAETLFGSPGGHKPVQIADYRDRFILLLRQGGAHVTVNGPGIWNRHPANANLHFDCFDAHAVLGALQPLLAASTGSACASGHPQPSHVLRALGLSAEDSDASIRFSFGRSPQLKTSKQPYNFRFDPTPIKKYAVDRGSGQWIDMAYAPLSENYSLRYWEMPL